MSADPRYPTTTVGQLQEQLEGLDPQATVDFGGLRFIDFTRRSPNHYQARFEQLVYLQDNGAVAVDNDTP